MKKLPNVFYEVNPAYFYDSNQDGYGDLRGLIQKFKYFVHLGVQHLILPNILKQYQPNQKKNYRTISNQIGSIEDFQKLIELAKNFNINILIEIDIAEVNKNHEWLTLKNKPQQSNQNVFSMNTEDMQKQFIDDGPNPRYFVDSITQEMQFNWTNTEVLTNFTEVAKFWIDLNVKGFVINNFEKVFFDKSNSKAIKKLNQRAFLNGLKFRRQIDDIGIKKQFHPLILGKCQKLTPEEAEKMTKKPNAVFDFLITSKFAFLGTHKKYGLDKKSKFRFQKILKLFVQWKKVSNLILAFGSSQIGRVVSRWGNSENFHKQSAKSIFILQVFLGLPYSIYYGEEIGMTNIGLSKIDNFQDTTLIERKNFLKVKHKIREKIFFDAQSTFNPINAANPMQWSNKKNAGFSLADHLVVPVSKNYEIVNVNLQYLNKNSVLSFYQQVIKLSKNENFVNFLKVSELIIRNFNGLFQNRNLIKFRWKNQLENLFIFSNFGKSKIKFNPPKDSVLLLSSYADSKYARTVVSLFPYETLVFYQNPLKLNQHSVFGIKTKKILRKNASTNKSNQSDILNDQKSHGYLNVVSQWKLTDIIIHRNKQLKKHQSHKVFIKIFHPQEDYFQPWSDKNVFYDEKLQKPLFQPKIEMFYPSFSSKGKSELFLTDENLQDLLKEQRQKSFNLEESQQTEFKNAIKVKDFWPQKDNISQTSTFFSEKKELNEIASLNLMDKTINIDKPATRLKSEVISTDTSAKLEVVNNFLADNFLDDVNSISDLNSENDFNWNKLQKTVIKTFHPNKIKGSLENIRELEKNFIKQRDKFNENKIEKEFSSIANLTDDFEIK